MRISIVLPAYNEADGLRYCLDSIAAQTMKPHEVIVVDNNSTDNTVEIAESYAFVTVIYEPEQGIAPATKTGFLHANGDIIARFNADVALSPTWVEKTNTFFTKHPEYAGMTGLGSVPVLPGLRVKTPVWSWMYSLGAELYLGIVPLWGGNYALRMDVAKQYVTKLKDSGEYHDDIDLGLHLAYAGERVKRVWHPLVVTTEDSYGYTPKMFHYFAKTIRTKNHHTKHQPHATPSQSKLSLLQRGFRLLICAVPLTVYIIISVISWPLYQLRMKLVQ